MVKESNGHLMYEIALENVKFEYEKELRNLEKRINQEGDNISEEERINLQMKIDQMIEEKSGVSKELFPHNLIKGEYEEWEQHSTDEELFVGETVEIA